MKFLLPSTSRCSSVVLSCFVVTTSVFLLHPYIAHTQSTQNVPAYVFDHWLHTKSIVKAIDPPRLAELDRLNCARVLANDQSYIENFVAVHGRITFKDPRSQKRLPMDCASIRNRHYAFSSDADRENDASKPFPLAYARVVNKDYVFLELELAASYSHRNWYCYAVDAKAKRGVKYRMRKLAKCLPNILLVEEWAVEGTGHNMTRAHMACLEKLDAPDKKWEYVALLQNYDVMIRTNREAVQAYRWLNGANDVSVEHLPKRRIDETLDWSFAALRLFRNDTRNYEWVNGLPPILRLAKGYAQCSLTRAMVKFMVRELDLTEFINRMDLFDFGVDEIIIPTLQATDALRAPGGFTHSCLDKDIQIYQITRLSYWYDRHLCGTGHMRHSLCVFGLEDLGSKLAVEANFFANKVLPQFDFGAAMCWYEAMFNRTLLSSTEAIDKHKTSLIYLPHVRFQKYRHTVQRVFAHGDTTKMNALGSYKQAMDRYKCNNES